MRGLAVPFGSPTLIAELDENGRRRIYLEEFDARSFADMPARLPLVRQHDRSRPLSWARLEPRADGVHANLEPIDGSQASADATAEVRAGVTLGLSVGFIADPDADEITKERLGMVPRILRRGATLKELSLVDRGAYPGAVIYAPDLDRYEHEQSEKLMQPWREEQERQASERRQRDAELLRRLDSLAAVRWQEGAPGQEAEPLRSTEPARQREAGTSGLLVGIGGLRLRVRTDDREEANRRAREA